MLHTEIQSDLAELLQEAFAIDMLGHENADVWEVRQLARHLMSLVARANALCDALVNVELSMHDDPDLSAPRESGDGPSTRPPAATARVADLAFIMRMELMHKQRGLENALSRPRIHLLAECESCQRRLTEGLTAL